MTERLRIVVAGTLVGVPRQGGATWAVLQWVLGLRALGHEIVVVEEVAPERLAAATPAFDALVERFGLGPEAALVPRGTGVPGVVDGADLLLNISGVLTDERLLARCGTRVFVDLDPAFTQMWHEIEGVDLGLDRHERFVTIGRAIGTDGCTVPTCGRSWTTTAQPIVLDHWPVAGEAVDECLTTVGHWRAYGSVHHDGVHYGQKAHALRPMVDLPHRTAAGFRLALGIDPGERDDLAALHRHGWELVDPDVVAGDLDTYRAFVQGSWAEFGLAKLGYVASRCGWFSDRSLCYLASGRPVVAQDTGFGDWLPTGDGVLPFSTADEAAAAIEAVRGDYGRHRRAARRIAEDVFDARIVLPELLACL